MVTALEHPWAAPPAPGTTLTVAPGIRWLRMPLPFALNHINLWLLDDGDGVTVVDTGLGLPDTRALWERIFTHELHGKRISRVIAWHRSAIEATCGRSLGCASAAQVIPATSTAAVPAARAAEASDAGGLRVAGREGASEGQQVVGLGPREHAFAAVANP